MVSAAEVSITQSIVIGRRLALKRLFKGSEIALEDKW
jgi:hypothetical protein